MRRLNSVIGMIGHEDLPVWSMTPTHLHDPEAWPNKYDAILHNWRDVLYWKKKNTQNRNQGSFYTLEDPLLHYWTATLWGHSYFFEMRISKMVLFQLKADCCSQRSVNTSIGLCGISGHSLPYSC